MNLKSKLIAAVVIILGITAITSCDKTDTAYLEKEVIENENLLYTNNDDDPLYEECITNLIDLNVHFWTKLAMNSLDEVEYVCENEDIEGLVNLVGFTEDELSAYMDSSIYYAQCINPEIDSTVCNCTSEIDFDAIYDFVVEIHDNGGPVEFFAVYNQGGGSGSSLGPVAECAAACTLTCMPMTYYPPAWLACMATCTGACYYISTN